MRRDMDLIRELLVGLADDQLSAVDPDSTDFATRMLHLEMLVDAGLIVGLIVRSMHAEFPTHFEFSRITWKGHDFLDAATSPTVWQNAKASISKLGGASSWNVWIAVLQKCANQLMSE